MQLTGILSCFYNQWQKIAKRNKGKVFFVSGKSSVVGSLDIIKSPLENLKFGNIFT